MITIPPNQPGARCPWACAYQSRPSAGRTASIPSTKRCWPTLSASHSSVCSKHFLLPSGSRSCCTTHSACPYQNGDRVLADGVFWTVVLYAPVQCFPHHPVSFFVGRSCALSWVLRAVRLVSGKPLAVGGDPVVDAVLHAPDQRQTVERAGGVRAEGYRDEEVEGLGAPVTGPLRRHGPGGLPARFRGQADG